MTDLAHPRKRLPRYKRAAKPLPHRLTKRDRDILEALMTYGFLTALQLCRLLTGSKSPLSYFRDRLKKLWHAHLVDRLFLPRAPHGSPLTVYTLKRRNPTYRSLYFLEHHLATMDFLLAVRALTQNNNVEVSQVTLEGQLRKNPVKVKEGTREVAVIPDCYLKLLLHSAGQSYELAWCVEIDRGTQSSSTAFRRKAARYLAFAQGPYQEAYGTTAITIVIITTAGQKRLDNLTRALEDELLHLEQLGQADLFRLTSADLAHERPEKLFKEPRFRVPFSAERVPLIGGLNTHETR